MINSKVGNKVVLIMFIHISLKLLVSGSLSLQAFWEISTIASWNRLLLSKLSTSLSIVILSGDNVVINTKVWYEVVFIMLVHIGLEFLISSSFGLQAFWEVGTIACWDGLLLGELSSCFSIVILSCDNVMVNSEVWYEIVLIVLVHIGLEFLVSSSLGFEAFWEVS